MTKMNRLGKCYVCHKLTGIMDALKKNAYDQNEQTIKMLSMSRCDGNY